jgi:hypothetical protein
MLRDRLSVGLVTGLAGGILLALFLSAVQAAGGSALVSTSGLGTWPDVILLFAVAIGWAVGYVYTAHSRPQLLTQPWISGTVFGVLVYVCRQIALAINGAWHVPAGPSVVAVGLIAHVVFYGIPVALLVSHFLRRA